MVHTTFKEVVLVSLVVLSFLHVFNAIHCLVHTEIYWECPMTHSHINLFVFPKQIAKHKYWTVKAVADRIFCHLSSTTCAASNLRLWDINKTSKSCMSMFTCCASNCRWNAMLRDDQMESRNYLASHIFRGKLRTPKLKNFNSEWKSTQRHWHYFLLSDQINGDAFLLLQWRQS